VIHLDDADEGAGPSVLRGERHDGDGHDDPVGVAEQHDGRHQRHHLGALGERRHGLNGAAGHGGGAGGGADPVEARAAHGEDLPPAAPPDDPRSIAAEQAVTAANTDDDDAPPAAAGAATVAAERQGRGTYAQRCRAGRRPGPRGSVTDRAHGGVHGHARPDRRHGWSNLIQQPARGRSRARHTASSQAGAAWLALPLSLRGARQGSPRASRGEPGPWQCGGSERAACAGAVDRRLGWLVD